MMVLVVENDALSAEVLAVRLGQLGCEVRLAWSPEEALAIARAERPKLILTETRLGRQPGGALALMDQLADEPGLDAVPVIVHSIYALKPGDEPALDGRVAGYLPKPFRLPALQALVAAHRPDARPQVL